MDDNIYKLNVSGKIFQIKHDVLMRIPYFEGYFEYSKYDNDEIFVSRSSKIFKHVLNHIID